MHEIALAVSPTLIGGVTLGAAWLRWRYARLLGPTKVGAKAPELDGLVDADGRRYSLESFGQPRAMVLVFMSNRCPGVKAYDERLLRLQEEYRNTGAVFVGINPIDERLYPSESLPEMAAASCARGLNYPYLKDATQQVAHRYGALCTPHVFVVDNKHRLRYRGRIDDAFTPSRVKHHYLRDAIEDVLGERQVRVAETAPLGCTIDWSYPTRDRAPSLFQRVCASVFE